MVPIVKKSYNYTCNKCLYNIYIVMDGEISMGLLNKHKEKVFLLLTLIIIGGLCYHYRQYAELLQNPIKFKEYVLSLGWIGLIIYILLQMIQVIVFFIPGEVIQIAIGCAYGTILGTILTTIGISFGSLIIFLLSRKYGRPLVEKLVNEKYLTYLENVLNCRRKNLIVFLLYFMPGMPKDSIIFVCGISKIELKNFIIYSTLGRLPFIIVSCYYGSNIAVGNKTSLILTTIIIVIAFVIGLLNKDKILIVFKKQAAL